MRRHVFALISLLVTAGASGAGVPVQQAGSDAALVLGNGRLTPWLFLAFAAFVVWLDLGRARCAL